VDCVVEQEVEVLAKRGIWLLALAAVLVAAAPAEAKEKERQQDAVHVSETGVGVGIAPSAPDWVRDGVAAIHESAVANDAPDVGVADGAEAALQAAWYGCRDVWAYRGYNHVFGWNLFRYYQQVSWCSNGYTIYSWSRFRWAEINGPGWAFDGHVDSSLGGSTTHKTAFTQGQFHACYVGWCDYKVPWVLLDVYVNGGWSADTGG
jgi:hypothetical protein